MAVLVDTNILLRSVQPHHPHYGAVERAFSILRANRETLHVTIQNFIEFWAVATRPTGNANGLGMSTESAMAELDILVDLFPLLPESGGLFAEWRRLVTTYKVSGKNTHDARLVAAMRMHGIAKILTFNAQDFTRYEGITAVDPMTMA